LDIGVWYGSFDYAGRVKRMFSPRVEVPTDQSTVTIPNGPAEVSTMDQVLQDAAGGLLGHNALLQQAARLGANVTDNYGRLRPKGSSVPLREDFNTLDNPFFWSPQTGFVTANAPGMHFVAFLPASRLFHRARRAMDGVMPDGTNFREAPYSISDENNGINARIRAPRRHRSFPLWNCSSDIGIYLPLEGRCAHTYRSRDPGRLRARGRGRLHPHHERQLRLAVRIHRGGA
jgi:hypothetical protein